ncbi:hypothetical protein BSLG_003603 [Batrachochytrium salamandrivorans]|nr:hypothetical protein BSLG_003603 [Batrachochytrium salamandrivorans]
MENSSYNSSPLYVILSHDACSKDPARVGVQPDELFELQVVQSCLILSTTLQLKADLRGLQFTAAKEIDIGRGRKAVVIFVPVPLVKQFHKRRILRKPDHKARVTQKRPYSRTLTPVHEKILEDLFTPTEIVGKRTKVRVDGSKLIKVFLDRKDHISRVQARNLSATYKQLTGKEVALSSRCQRRPGINPSLSILF